MADFRKWIIVLAALALFAGLAGAQSVGSNTETCVASAAVTPQIRAEGLTELVGDILITCTGGQPLVPGAQVPTTNITIYFNGTVTSRLLGTASVSGASEALLLIDDPQSAGAGGGEPYGNTLPQILCTVAGAGVPLQGAGANGCTQWLGVGNTSGYTVLPAGTLVPVATNPNTGAGGAFSNAPLAPGANVYQGVVSTGSVTFYGIPVVAPVSSGANRVYRITNVRINAYGIVGGGSVVTPVTAAIASGGGNAALPVTNSSLTVAYVAPSLNTTLTKALSTSSTGFSTSVGLNQCQSYPSSGSTPVALETLRFQELLGTAFKIRGTTTQTLPGFLYNTESGLTFGALTNVSSSTGATYTAGYADWGTRLKAVFSNIPTGVSLFVSTSNLNTSAGDASSMTTLAAAQASNSSFAQLIVSETSPDNGTVPPIITQTGTSSTIGYAPLVITGNSASAVWEVTNSLPNTPENFDFEVFMTVTSNVAQSIPPAPSTMTVNLSYAPIPTQGAFTLTTGGTAQSTLGIPRFADTSKAATALTFAICQTALLFPYVQNVAGFDTGLSIANTSSDPFGTTPQTGSCSINWYGLAAPAAGYLGSAGYQTTAPTTTQLIAAGTTAAWTVSSTAPGFDGYVIALCNFQYAHGFAFVSDLGARNLAMGYLADVINGTIAAGQRGGAPNAIEANGQ